ncbi:hypothetical protein QAD02_019281 [Eretmocerus hayati]|uniref:Uncharacterized protein n=1 Tax=Eretmocerus hayati TaxID=131215 RepID=A0ACC2PJL0_9HYME|nr:hypothetical protein QAD02_019281 [Eretmocerus hayati]
MRAFSLGFILLLVTEIGNYPVSTYKSLPLKLQRCYNNSGRLVPPLPMNLQVILDIIRKLERYTEHTMTLRTFSASLVKGFKLDGVRYKDVITRTEGVLNWVATGPQRAKNRIVQELIPGLNILISDAENVLTNDEFCTLHFALSNTIWDHYDIQEKIQCEPQLLERYDLENLPIGRPSRLIGESCPKESGVILTPFYTIALGSVIAAIAAALEPQNVKTRVLLSNPMTDDLDDWTFSGINPDVEWIGPRKSLNHDKSLWLEFASFSGSEIDNVWMSTISGELAEMVIYQGPIYDEQMYLGASGFWNNTMQPQVYYIRQNVDNFDFTRAEIIGAIDGLIIGKNLGTWVKRFDSLRLSQIIDMYYSEEGVNFDRNVRVCQRGHQFRLVAPKDLMEEETYAAAQALGYVNSVASIDQRALRQMVRYSVDLFLLYTSHELLGAVQCLSKTSPKRPRVELILAFDGSWTQTYTANFFSVLVQDFDVSAYGSRMGIINGESGEWLLNKTDSPSTVHRSINILKNIQWPRGMNLLVIFRTILTYLDDYWNHKSKTSTIGSYGQAILLLVFRLIMTKDELMSAIALLKVIKSRHPEVYFMYYTRNSTVGSLEDFILTNEDMVVTSLKIDDISSYLLQVPLTLKFLNCEQIIAKVAPRTVDYVGPAEASTYRLHAHWHTNFKKVTVKLYGVGYGSLTVCSWNQISTSDERIGIVCQELRSRDDFYVKDHRTCEDLTCPDTFLQVSYSSTLTRCTESDCRSPDRVKYVIELKLLDCSSTWRAEPNSPMIFITIIIMMAL